MMRIGVGALRYLMIVITLGLFLLHHLLIKIFLRNEHKRLRYFLESIRLTSRFILFILGVQVEVQGLGDKKISGGFIVSNHLSYLDVLILFQNFPSLFITSTEIQKTPVLGPICELSGCFFVERRKEKRNEKTKLEELNKIKEKFNQGFNIFLFPEGTSTDGSGVLPFKATFFQLAVETQSPVYPVCLRYSGDNAHLPPWYGDMTFPDHLFKLCLEKELRVRVVLLPDISGTDKFSLAELCHQKINGVYVQSISDSKSEKELSSERSPFKIGP